MSDLIYLLLPLRLTVVVVEARRRYSLLCFVACNLAAFAVVPSLLYTSALYPFIPLSIVMLGQNPTGN